ncbi:Gfo/Idh/MocA family oxidoreductase [Flavivirga aquimarina]|uniref:Gfo/Idh/MocA family oxidoreductase n=2 Tax=Flavivirga TaxID=1209327 RepID=A0ABT8W6Z4_9FLAO|nr:MULTISPECIES: Gfo/Idh/MocA family oxidoreductase [Flavivirga]MDO5968890.1 Gfo/Idh/MocA family oxidoreductase [Flavivirga aquimarina]MDO5973150.1 Gfo/Idh/MocA family oxidoreductase [Flavivirga jejuensis]
MIKLNIGIVGLGRLGKEYANNIAYLVHNANLIAACSLVQEELDFARDTCGVKNLYSSYEDMLTNKEIDAVAIITSTDQHADQIIMAVEAGFHVFCEKPLAINIEDCYKVEKVVEKYPDQITMLGFVRRYDPSYADAKTKLDEGLVGSPFFVRSQTVDKDVFAPFQIEYCTASGGMFHDFSVHDIDLAHWFLGSDIKKVWSLGGAYRFKEFGEAGDADNVFAMCELENGTTAVIAASRVSPFGHNTFTEIMATEGNLKVGDPPRKNMLEIADVHGVRYECLETFFERFKGAFLVQIQDFVDCVLEGKQPALTMQNATKATLVANALTLSFKEKRLINVDDLVLQAK